MPHYPANAHKGFTLLEVMIAISITALIGVA
jgi:prepilin-type N-terminal cleavage/methylation domain-containing protein